MKWFIFLFITVFANDSTAIYHLPANTPLDTEYIFENKGLEYIGVPLVPELSEIVSVGGRYVISVPVLMNEPNIPAGFKNKLTNPSFWGDKEKEIAFGRRSMWYMEEGQTILYSVLIDPRKHDDIGVGFVAVNFIGDDIYDVILYDIFNNILFAGRGEYIQLDQDLGMAYLNVLADQTEVRDKYDMLWNIKPEDFFLFGY